MKKTFLFMMASALLIVSACTKDGFTPDLPSNSWILNTNEYPVKVTSRDDNSILFDDDADDTKNNVSVEFANLPTKGGTYDIVANGAALSDNQCHIRVTNPSGTALFYQGTGASAEVIINKNGKIIVNVPEINVGALPAAVFKFKGSLYEL